MSLIPSICSNQVMMALHNTRLEPQSTDASTVMSSKARQPTVIAVTNFAKFHAVVVTKGKCGAEWSQELPPRRLHVNEGQETVSQPNLTKLAPVELDTDSHPPESGVATIREIAAIKHGDATTTAASDKEIQLCFQTLGPGMTTRTQGLRIDCDSFAAFPTWCDSFHLMTFCIQLKSLCSSKREKFNCVSLLHLKCVQNSRSLTVHLRSWQFCWHMKKSQITVTLKGLVSSARE